MLLLFGAVVLLLAVACANVAGLLLARTARRGREIALRSAFGASRSRILAQLLTESMLLAVTGGALGIALARVLTGLVVTRGPSDVPRLTEVTIDASVLLFALAVSIATGLAFGLVPALEANKVDLVQALKTSTRGLSSPLRSRRWLIVGEVALAVVLLTGAGLFFRSFLALHRVDPGFRKENLLTMNFLLPLTEFREIPKRIQYFDTVLSRLSALPGVEAAAVTTDLPFGTGSVPHNLAFEGRPMAEGEEPEIFYRGISTDYFDAMRIELLEGRPFTRQDREDGLPVAIANETFVKQFYPNDSPLGKRVRWARREEVRWMTIVGVVRDVKPSALDADEVPALYVPFRQEQDWWRNWMSLVLRTSTDPALLEAPVKNAVSEIHGGIPVADVVPMTQLVARSSDERRFQLTVLGSFATAALFLAAVGIFGLLSYSVSERRDELGVRLALGASRRQIVTMVVSQAIGLAGFGLVLGVTTSLLLQGVVSSFLFGIRPAEPATYTATAVLLMAVAVMASLVPAMRASRVDPSHSMRYE